MIEPYYESDGQVIYCGDSVAVMREVIPDESIDLTVTSPPYDNLRTYSADKPMSELWDFEGVAQELWRVTKPGGVVVWVVADATIDGSETGTSFRQALRFMEIGFRLHDTMIYHRQGPYPETVRYSQAWEYMFVMSKGQPSRVNLIADKPNLYGGTKATRPKMNRQKDGTLPAYNGKERIRKEIGVRQNVWYIPAGGGVSSGDAVAFNHPAIFPEPLARDHILSWSSETDTVFDPFCGSGTTLKMARLMGRKGIGIEVNAEYCEIAANRLRQKVLAFPLDSEDNGKAI